MMNLIVILRLKKRLKPVSDTNNDSDNDANSKIHKPIKKDNNNNYDIRHGLGLAYTKTINGKERKYYKIPILYDNDNGTDGTGGNDLYLTYNGIVKMLYVSNSLTANNFQKWASRSLFTLQMGTLENKKQLISEMGI